MAITLPSCMTTAPFAWYQFAGNVKDSMDAYSGTSTDVTYEAAPTDKNFGSQIAVFNGSSSFVALPNLSVISGSKPRTFLFWANIGKGRVLICLGTGLAYNCNGRKNMHINISPTHGAFASWSLGEVGKDLTNTDWHFWAFSYAGGTFGTSSVKIFFDGVEQTTTKTSSDFCTSAQTLDTDTASGCFIGKITDNGSYAVFWEGRLGSLRLYNSVLGGDEIAAIYQAESARSATNNYLEFLSRRNRHPLSVTNNTS